MQAKFLFRNIFLRFCIFTALIQSVLTLSFFIHKSAVISFLTDIQPFIVLGHNFHLDSLIVLFSMLGLVLATSFWLSGRLYGRDCILYGVTGFTAGLVVADFMVQIIRPIFLV